MKADFFDTMKRLILTMNIAKKTRKIVSVMKETGKVS